MIDGYSIKLACPLIEEIILHLVNLSLSKSQYPQYWKVSKISPYYKKGDKQLTENYRPVSNLISVGMICEKVITEQVFYHFDQNKLWHQNHHGFGPNHSTATALINLTDLWLQAADNGKLTAALLLDLSASFDFVDHQVLIGKLRLYGLYETRAFSRIFCLTWVPFFPQTLKKFSKHTRPPLKMQNSSDLAHLKLKK